MSGKEIDHRRKISKSEIVGMVEVVGHHDVFGLPVIAKLNIMLAICLSTS